LPSFSLTLRNLLLDEVQKFALVAEVRQHRLMCVFHVFLDYDVFNWKPPVDHVARAHDDVDDGRRDTTRHS